MGICKRAAELATAAIGGLPSELVGIEPEQIRNEILADGNSWVDLENLTEYCWSRGVPVLHVTNFPSGIHKPDAMLISVHGRPAIIICKKNKQPAWLLFFLAHELGHLIAGHVSGDSLIVDSKITDDVDEKDDEETIADKNAIAILTGSETRSYRTNRTPPNASHLAKICQRKGINDSVYPGHIVLNYVHGLSGSFHALGAAALLVLYPNANAQKVLNRCLARNIDFDELPEDHAEYLMRIVGANERSS
ncbi:hypothetical protein Q31b_41940 [Novipirellula aureliae]|uniref:IrrE N-terminal-like domain-containing protein n=1 Tax=Novipirellula aureliae TaxID=2527966 RepID=A0A5C6DUL0_9BACT|nr:hypothetical protein [Novipirellula aureliae]TWU39111.1 hypothetical protein Q31b_41940 [Novipirellula aureliae]